jgi:hypothetical protein
MLYAAANPASPLTIPQRQQRLAAVVGSTGRWVTTDDDRGAQLVIPNNAGGYVPISDKWGRPVILSWDQLQKRSGYASGNWSNAGAAGDPHLKAWLSPPPAPPPPRVAAAAPAPAAAAPPQPAPIAYSNQAKFHAISAALEAQESGGNPGAVGPATFAGNARGLYGLLPATAQAAAARMGVAYDPSMLADPVWNKRLGENEIQHQLVMAHGSVPLALAAYNAGPGRVYGGADPHTGRYNPGWLRTIGDPRSGNIDVDEWVRRIPFKETREYIGRILPHAMAILQRGG